MPGVDGYAWALVGIAALWIAGFTYHVVRIASGKDRRNPHGLTEDAFTADIKPMKRKPKAPPPAE